MLSVQGSWVQPQLPTICIGIPILIQVVQARKQPPILVGVVDVPYVPCSAARIDCTHRMTALAAAFDFRY